jgi:hypothetical protein
VLVIAAQEVVSPGGGSDERGIRDHRRTIEDFRGFMIILQAVISPCPEAFLVIQLAAPVEGATTWAVTLGF